MGTRSESVRARQRPPSRRQSGPGGARTTLVRSWNPSTLLTVTTGALLTLGLMMILSASFVSPLATYGSPFLYFKKQVLWAAVGVVGFIVFSRWDYRRLRGIGYVLMGVTIVLLIAVLIPGVGVMVGGSSRWLRIGALSFQPSELAKLSLLMFAADVFARRDDRAFGELPRTLLPMVPALGVLTLLIMMQPDLGTTLLLVCIGMSMLFIAGAPMRHLLPMGGLTAATAAVAAYAAPYRRERLMAFIDPWSDPLDTGYQTIQSLIALGSGGWFGVGLGASRQKWSYVPNAHTDFIYAILGEEIGFFGTLMVWGMFGLIAFIGITAARRAPDRYGMLLASGITVWISVQAIVNVGAVTASLPITGVPLPLVSFGGSSLVISLIAMGILTNIAASSHTRRNKAPTRAS